MKASFTVAVLAFASTAHAAGFDCSKASTLVEKTICSEKQLSDLDDSLLRSYKAAIAGARDVAALKTDQLTWLRNVRNKCLDAPCLKRVYTERVAWLDTGLRTATASGTSEPNRTAGATTANQPPSQAKSTLPIDTMAAASAKLMAAAKFGELDGNAWFYDGFGHSDAYSSTKFSITGCEARLTREVRRDTRCRPLSGMEVCETKNYHEDVVYSLNLATKLREGERSRADFDRAFGQLIGAVEGQFQSETFQLEKVKEWRPSSPCRAFIIGFNPSERDTEKQYRACAESVKGAIELQRAAYSIYYWCTVPNLQMQREAAEAKAQATEAQAPPTEPRPARPAGRWPETSERDLVDADLQGMDLTDLILMRNEIYARRGRRFKTPAVRRYFESQPWYTGVADEVSGLTATELRNVDRILRAEKRKGGA